MAKDIKRFQFADNFKAVAKSFGENSSCVLELFGECDEPSISSHSISATGLRMISEDHEVVRCAMDMTEKDRKDFIQFRKVSPKVASTFSGFCKTHDQNLFKSIDARTFEISEEHLALYMYRATAQELFKKARNLAVFSSIKEVTGDGKVSIPEDLFHAKVGTELGFSDALKHFSTIKDCIENGSFGEIRYLCFKFETIVPFAYLGAVNFRYFPQYNKFDLFEESKDEGSTIGVIPQCDGSIFFVVWKRGYEKILAPILKRFKPAKNAILEFAFQLGMEHCENIFFRPSWFEKFNEQQLALLKKFMLSNINDYMSNPNARPFAPIFEAQRLKRPKLLTNSGSFRAKFK